MKKLLALLLTLVMLLNMVPIATAADDAGHDHAAAECTDIACDDHGDHDEPALAATPRATGSSGYNCPECGEPCTEWLPSDFEHYRYCQSVICKFREEEAHYGGDGSCKPACEVCGRRYIDPTSDVHRYEGEWQNGYETHHYRDCDDCFGGRVYEPHYGGIATCEDYAVCKGCGGVYGELADHTGSDGTCSPICEVCGERLYDATGEHSGMGSWGRINETQHYRFCEDCLKREIGDHISGNDSCIPHLRDLRLDLYQCRRSALPHDRMGV